MGADPRESWRSRMRTVRVRTTLFATAVVAAALLIGSFTLVAVMKSTLTNEVRAVARLRAFEVASAIESSNGSRLPEFKDEDELIQVVDPSGKVVVSSPGLSGGVNLPSLEPGGSRNISVPSDDDDFVAVAEAAGTPDGRFKVLVALSLEEVADTVLVVRRLLTIGLPVLLLVVAFITWKVVGRSLAPVEAMRREVDRISSSELQRRVPEAPGSDEISRLAATMNRMLGRLEASQARQRRFVSDASHELRSPVASIRQNAEVALAHPEVTDARSLAETVLAENMRVQRLVEDLLLLANADERKVPRADKDVDLDDLVFEEASLVRDSGKVKVDSSRVGAGRVRGDALQLRRMIGNLGENAAKHAGSQVGFSLSEGDGYVVLQIDDDGPGIPPEERERVFERFVRLDQARDREGGGSGLGLAIVAEIVATHGGTVTAGPSPLGGARIEVLLPKASG